MPRLRHVALVVLAPALCTAQTPSITSPAVQRTRAVWFVEGNPPIGAEVGFLAEALAWDKPTEKAFAAARPGARVPFGAAVWPALSTFTDLTFGAVTVAAGDHYVVLEKAKDGWLLGLLDPEAVRGKQLAPGTAAGVPLTAAIPLAFDKSKKGPLRITWEPSPTPDGITLALQCGAGTLRATARVAGAVDAPLLFPDPRSASRMSFGKNAAGTDAFAVVDHGLPAWNGDLAGQAKKLPVGRRWRLGKDWATTLDTNAPLQLGGQALPAGSWHLTLAHTDQGWDLVVSSAPADHRARIDGFGADYVTPVLTVPMTTKALAKAAKKLAVGFEVDGKDTVLAIEFGDQRLLVPVAVAKS